MFVTTSMPSTPVSPSRSEDTSTLSTAHNSKVSARRAGGPREAAMAAPRTLGESGSDAVGSMPLFPSAAATPNTPSTAWYNNTNTSGPYPRHSSSAAGTASAAAAAAAASAAAPSSAAGASGSRGRPNGLRIAVEASDREEEGAASVSLANALSPPKHGVGMGRGSDAMSGPAVTMPTTTVTIASVSSAVAVATQQARESLVQWRRPQRPIDFREWYISRHCNEQQVRWMGEVQNLLRPLQPLFVRYFQLWSLTGEAEFYTLFVPTVVWLGGPLEGVQIASLLCVGQYVTGTIKDCVCCPRPPCPPLQLFGKRSTHDNEYGFPSTHSSHSGVFSFFIYCQLLSLFPEHGFLCWLAAAYYFVNVSFSRIYLGMHWIGDLIGGWTVAFISILFHVSFLDDWEAAILTRGDAPWWAYILVYVFLHVLAMAHATPHDPCPCYVDSMRFVGVMAGSTIGFWCFYAMYGTLSARPRAEKKFDTLFSVEFLVQWVVCILIVFASKELSSYLGGYALKYLFKCMSGAYAQRLPNALQRPYLAVARAIGFTTLGNERGPRRYVPFTANNSFSFMQSGVYAEGVVQDSGINGDRRTPNPRAESEVVEEPDGYVASSQVWSLRTHRHWWLWDVHKRTISYAITGFVIAFVCQVLLREAFGVGKGSQPPSKPPTLAP